MCEGILERLQNLGLVVGRGNQRFGVDSHGNRSADHTGEIVIRGDNVHVHFADGTNSLARTPRVLFRRNCVGEPLEALLVVGNFVKKFHPSTRGWARRKGCGFLLSEGRGTRTKKEQEQQQGGTAHQLSPICGKYDVNECYTGTAPRHYLAKDSEAKRKEA